MQAGRAQPGHRHLPAEPFRAGSAPRQHQRRMVLIHDHAHTNTATEGTQIGGTACLRNFSVDHVV